MKDKTVRFDKNYGLVTIDLSNGSKIKNQSVTNILLYKILKTLEKIEDNTNDLNNKTRG